MPHFHSIVAVIVSALIACQVQDVSAKDGFIATLPQILRHRTQSEFCMTMYGQGEGTKQASLRLIDVDSGDRALQLQEDYTPGVQKCTQFQVPKEGTYEMLLFNDTDILHDSVEIQVQGDKPLTLVQTDKPMYKPGQLVKFRIMTLLYNMKPRVGQIASVYISDPNDIRVKQFLNIDNQGLTSLEFQLVDRAKLGNWKIEVNLEDSSKPTFTTFEVKEYVLPRFEVSITPPPYILSTDETIKGEVCAKYTYGKPVTGFLDLKIWWGSTGRPMRIDAPKFTEVVEFTGCHKYTVNLTEIMDANDMGYRIMVFQGELQIEASVTEAGTGFVVNKTHSGPRESYEPLTIKMEDYTNGYFKPGLPYFGKVTVTRPDGSPANAENIRIRATGSPVRSRYSSNFTTDESGVIVFALCESFTENITSFSLEAMALDYERTTYTPGQRSLHTPQGYKHINQWFSPSLSYIQIPKIETTEECHNQLTLSIPFTTVANKDVTFTYQIMARGKIVKKGQVSYEHTNTYPGQDQVTPPKHTCLNWEEVTTPAPPPTPPVPEPEDESDSDDDEPTAEASEESMEEDEERLIAPPLPGAGYPPAPEEYKEPIVRSEVVSDTTANFILDFTISTEMSPRFTLLVYHVLPDGEVVADSMEFNVKPCFANEVGLKFNTSEALPGQDVSLSLTAAPGSLCGVGVVDKSVNILGGNHQITPDVVFKRIEELSRSQFHYMPIPYISDNEYCEERIKRLEESPANPDEFWFYTSPYVDAIQAFKSSGFRVLTNLDLETRPCERSYPIYYDFPVEPMPMEAGGMPGPGMPVPESINSSPGDRSNNLGNSQARVRSHFPETWLWSLQFVGEEGQSTMAEKAPDTVTSWVGNAVCLDQDQGFGVSGLTSLTTFQPFFVSLQLPYSAVRGERLPLILTIYNYLEKCLNIQLSLDVGSDFELSSKSNSESFCLCGGKSQSQRYYVTPQTIGRLNISAKAAVIAGNCGNSVEMDTQYIGHTDGVRRTMLVKAEGAMQEYSHSMYICSKDGKSDGEDVILPLPDNMVKDSARGEIKVIGDIMGPAMNNLNNLVRMPTGCGEQNMVGFVPNIWVLKYLTNTGRLTEEIQTKAIKHMEIGYQRELTYRHQDGSYSAFGERDPAGSVWLTAFVVKSFAQAKPYIYVDEDELALSIRFLKRSQLETGCFRETGKVFSSYMMGGLSKGKRKESYTSLTAYVLVALLQAGVSESERAIVEGVKCMNKDFHKEKAKMDPYSLALVAYVNTLLKPNSQVSANVMKTLDSKARTEGSFRYWSRETPKPAAVTTWYYYAAPSAEVEMTSYALLALLNFYGDQAIAQTHNIAMWLTQQRNPNGGFASTQDTVIGLQALSEFAELAYIDEDTDMTVSVTGEEMDKDFRVSDEQDNMLLMQSTPITKLPNQLKIKTSGVGCALVQASVNYNKPADKLLTAGRPPFYIKVMTRMYQHDVDRCDRRTLRFVLRLRNRKFSSGMSLVTVRMVTSWRPVEDSLTKLRSQFPLLGMKQYEYKEDEGLITFYFDEMTRRPKEFALDIEQDREMKISSPKPAEVKVFQYYETDVAVVKSYNVKTTCGTKLSIPRNRPGQLDAPGGFPVQVRLNSAAVLPELSDRDSSDPCPACFPLKSIPASLKSYVCESAAIYKGVAGRRGRKPLKIKQDIKPSKAKNLNVFAKYDMAPGCDCSMVTPPTKRVFIFASEEMKGKALKLDGSSAVLYATRKLEREIKKLRRSCGGASPQS